MIRSAALMSMMLVLASCSAATRRDAIAPVSPTTMKLMGQQFEGNRPVSPINTGNNSCQVPANGNCLGCARSCPAGTGAYCTGSNDHPMYGCTVVASCSCVPRS